MRHLLRLALALLLLSGLAGRAVAQERAPQAQFTMALTGDWMPSRRLSVYTEPPYLALIDLLRSADVAMGNMETLLHDYETFPMHLSGGIYVRSDPRITKDLAWTGLDMVARANNHAGDYGVEGMRLTSHYLDAAGIVHAGVGKSLREAREARFLDTAKGRIALVSVASTYPDHSRAGRSRGDIPARPGLSPLRYSGWFGVTEAQLDALTKTLNAIGVQVSPQNGELGLGYRFVVSDEPGFHSAANELDLSEVAQVVGSAHALADYTVISVHSHETEGDPHLPPTFLVQFAHRMIDAGADAIFAHGPHILRGIEIYKGKAIFYSLANFIFQPDTTLRVPEDNYARFGLMGRGEVADYVRKRDEIEGDSNQPEHWRSIVAVLRWTGDKLDRIELDPISLLHGQRLVDRGRPMLADAALGREIINQIAELSRPFGTQVEWRDGIGVIDLEKAQPAQ